MFAHSLICHEKMYNLTCFVLHSAKPAWSKLIKTEDVLKIHVLWLSRLLLLLFARCFFKTNKVCQKSDPVSQTGLPVSLECWTQNTVYTKPGLETCKVVSLFERLSELHIITQRICRFEMIHPPRANKPLSFHHGQPTSASFSLFLSRYVRPERPAGGAAGGWQHRLHPARCAHAPVQHHPGHPGWRHHRRPAGGGHGARPRDHQRAGTIHRQGKSMTSFGVWVVWQPCDLTRISWRSCGCSDSVYEHCSNNKPSCCSVRWRISRTLWAPMAEWRQTTVFTCG